MDDAKIVELYWSRSEQAISETESKYGKYCRTISFNILADTADAEECVNDTYLRAWNSMPSNRPSRLAPYLGKLTRWLSLNRLRDQDCLKRGNGELPLVLDELAETLDSGFDTEKELEIKELNQEIRHLLSNLQKEERDVFLSRYWYMASIAEIAEKSGFTDINPSICLKHPIILHLLMYSLCLATDGNIFLFKLTLCLEADVGYFK